MLLGGEDRAVGDSSLVCGDRACIVGRAPIVEPEVIGKPGVRLSHGDELARARMIYVEGAFAVTVEHNFDARRVFDDLPDISRL